MATIKEYIKRYHNFEKHNEAARTSLFHLFMRYFIGNCWGKMYLRIRPWTSKGYIYILGSLDEMRVPAVFKALMQNTLYRDPGLPMMLQDKDLLNSVSKEYHGMDDSVRDQMEFRHLPSGFEGNKSTYNQLTCFKFHQLLAGMLLGYRKTLNAFIKAKFCGGSLQVERLWCNSELIRQLF
jgi:hypothetical protein